MPSNPPCKHLNPAATTRTTRTSVSPWEGEAPAEPPSLVPRLSLGTHFPEALPRPSRLRSAPGPTGS